MRPGRARVIIATVATSSWLASACAGCGGGHDVVFVTAEVGFVEVESRAKEARSTLSIEVVTRGASATSVTVGYRIVPRGARPERPGGCGSRDFRLAEGTLTFAPGQTSARIEVSLVDDTEPEADEIAELTLHDARGARLGARAWHRVFIEDDDRDALVDVRALGASGDGRQDDTAALQAAIDRAARTPRAVVWFPPGTYLVSSLRLVPGLTYHGPGATLRSLPMVPQTARLLHIAYTGESDSPATTIQGFVLDGDRERQGPYQDSARDQAHLLAIDGADGAPPRPGRLRVLAQDLGLMRGAGDGLVAFGNVDLVACDLEAEDVWRDAFAVRGGNTRARLHGLRASGVQGTTGVAIVPTAAGASDTMRVEVSLQDARLDTGDLFVSVAQGSLVTVRGLTMNDPPFLLRALDSTLRFYDSAFWVGYPSDTANRIDSPGDTVFERCTFHLTETYRDGTRFTRGAADPSAVEADRDLQVADIYWNPVDRPADARRGQRLRFVDCTFWLSPDVEDGDAVYVARTRGGDPASDNEVVIQGGTVAAGYDGMFAPGCTRCTYRP